MDTNTPPPSPHRDFPVVGMVGGGQLARMTHQAAIGLGQSLRVLAVKADEPAPLVTPDVVPGGPDLESLRALAVGCDAVTFDHEGVPQEHLRALVGDGVAVRPHPDALLHAQDKLVMRRRLSAMGLPVPAYAEVTTPSQVEDFAAEHGWPVVLKAARGGYDGRGVWFLRSPDSAEGAAAGAPVRDLVAELLAAGTPLLVEEAVEMFRELAAQVARSPFGQAAAWPVVETVQEGGQCVEVLAPAPGLSEERALEAQSIALRIAHELDVTGLLAVELFETAGGLVINELAMRPHNSGHWTIEGARTSQFEQHLRAVLDYPLGTTSMTAPVVVMANVLGAEKTPEMSVDERIHHLFARFPQVKVHMYGKGERPLRKVGHVNVLGADLTEARRTAVLAAHWLSTAEWEDGWSVHSGREVGDRT
ncbi:5-(carboxyamino)imidazole ribonucleotide synthase [Pseudonocardia xishanensis]|uniref:N5-carboxyaminoimidazole ribonucleotide synthase n=1 Tax=Pseudonocardia xishanensis TaxID=630995 RepID=A0ABP8RJ47_9PSEU